MKRQNPIGYTKDESTRPQCSVPGCERLAANSSHKKGYFYWRRASWIKERYQDAQDIWCCTHHHNKETARRNNVKSASHLTAQRHGLTVSLYKHRYHPYLKHRKDYCENVDGRLGVVCENKLPTQEQLELIGLGDWKPYQLLEVDHINGDHTDNRPENLQTLCKQCHTIKSAIFKDYLTPGRKTRKNEE